MAKLRPIALALGLAALAAPLGAQTSAQRYLALKDDASLYVGEGQAEAEDFGGDGLKALSAARERAHAALAASIQVRITSEVQASSSVSGGVS
jgi:hypothetical protein